MAYKASWVRGETIMWNFTEDMYDYLLEAAKEHDNDNVKRHAKIGAAGVVWAYFGNNAGIGVGAGLRVAKRYMED